MSKLLNIAAILLLMMMSCSSSSNDEPDVKPVDIKANPDKVDMPATGGTSVLTVTSEKDWSVYSNDSWIHGEKTNSTTATITIDANTNTSDRAGNVYIKSGVRRIEIPVTQSAAMSVSETQLNSVSKGETFTLTVTAKDGWTAKANDSWIKVEKTNNTTLTVTTDKNESSDDRTGTLTVTLGSESITVTVNQNSADDETVNTPDGYNLVWQDEFKDDGTSFGKDWTFENWRAGMVNNELQTYVTGSVDGKPVAEKSDGRLNINLFKGSDGKFYSARLYAKRNEGWTYGWFEARIKLPKGKGTWPAFWMMPVVESPGWPASGEIDIMEWVGYDPQNVYSTIHCTKYNNTGTSIEQGKKVFAKGEESDWHTYACEWTPDALIFYVDGNKILTYSNDGKGNRDTWPFDKPFYMILNFAWGGAWGGQQGTDESVLPATYQIDYVRVFQKK